MRGVARRLPSVAPVMPPIPAHAASSHSEAGGIGLFVDALDDAAAGYYRRFGFAALPDNPLLLFLSAKMVG